MKQGMTMAHGGKDGHPFPVPLRSYDVVIGYLRKAIRRARIGRSESLRAMRRLDAHARSVEHRMASRGEEGPSWEALVQREWARSPALGGRTVADDAPARPRPIRAAPGQLSLFADR